MAVDQREVELTARLIVANDREPTIEDARALAEVVDSRSDLEDRVQELEEELAQAKDSDEELEEVKEQLAAAELKLEGANKALVDLREKLTKGIGAMLSIADQLKALTDPPPAPVVNISSVARKK